MYCSRFSGFVLGFIAESRCSDASTPERRGSDAVTQNGGKSALKTGRFLAIVTVAAAATLGGLAAWAAPMTSPVAPPQGGSLVTNAGYSCWWEHGCKYCRVCRGGYYGGGCSTVKKYCKKRGYYY